MGSGKYLLRHMPTNFIQTNFGNSNFTQCCTITCCKIIEFMISQHKFVELKAYITAI